MATTYVDYTATAGQTDFNFSFPYLEDSHVAVEVEGVNQVLTTNYTIETSPTQKIILSNPTTALAGGELVRIKRVSDPSTDLVDFVNGSVLTETELDRAYRHNRYLSEEAYDGVNSGLRELEGSTNFNANNKQIKNLADGTLATDAVNKGYVDTQIALTDTNLAGFYKSTHTGNGTDNVFTLSFTPQTTDAKAYIVSIDGLVQVPDTDYTIGATAITFNTIPTNSSEICVVATAAASVATVNEAQVTATGSTTARSLANRFADVVNVLDYGASTTASAADNTTAFSNAIASGRTVYIPAGTFNINYLDLSGIIDAQIIGEFQQTKLNFGTGINNLEGDSCAVLINNGYGGDTGTHPTASRRLRLDGFYIDANRLDIGIYIDKMTDSHLENIVIKDCDIGMKINYSWYNMFSNFDIQQFTSQGISTTFNNVNGIVFTGCRVSTPAENGISWLLSGNSIKVISCGAEGSSNVFTGMSIPSGRAISIDGCHFERGTGLTYSSGGNNVRSLSITNSFFDCDFAAITADNYANSLNITGCVFKDENSGVELNTLNGNFSGNYFDGTSTYTIGDNFKGYLHDGTRFISEKRLERQYIRIPTFSTNSATPTLLCTFPEYSRRTSGKILIEQRLSANNTSSQEINFAISEDETFRQTVVATVGTNLGITLSVVDNGDTRSIYGYGTYPANLAGYIDLVTY